MPDGSIDSDKINRYKIHDEIRHFFHANGIPRDSLLVLSRKRQGNRHGGYHGAIMQSNRGSHKNALANNDRTHWT